MKRIILILNAGAGSVEEESRGVLEQALAENGLEGEIWLSRGDELRELTQRAIAQKVDAVFAAGGDGTISGVASALAGTDIPLGVIPLGTLNHFAKDLGIPLPLAEALRALAVGESTQVDIGRVNGRTFINNSSIGLYPRMVRRRQVEMDHRGRKKWVGMIQAGFAVLRRFRLTRVRIGSNDQTFHLKTPFVFVGNNAYETGLLSVGSRTQLNSGLLSLYTPHKTSRWGLLRLAIRALLGKLNRTDAFTVVLGKEFWVDSHKKDMHVSIDGEILTLQPPLHYEILPGALKVLIPRKKED